jgi:Sulfotransferase family
MSTKIALQKPVVLFLHIHKTAGSTFHNIVERQYKKIKVFSFDRSNNTNKFNATSDKFINELHLIKGHFHFGIHNRLINPYEYITMLRDPFERTISHYYYASEAPNHYYHKMIKKGHLSLKDVLEKGDILNLDNGMVRMLSAKKNVPYGCCTTDMLEIANENLKNHFSLIGLQEHFDEFVIELSQRYQWKQFIYYSKKLIGKTRPPISKIDQETIQLIRSYNQLDLQLYNHWKPIIEKRMAEKDTSFKETVQKFKRKNAALNKYLGWWPAALTP